MIGIGEVWVVENVKSIQIGKTSYAFTPFDFL
jgi:hypothetical protein